MDEERKLSRLSDGVPGMPRRMTRREKYADQAYLFLQLGSRFLFLLAGVIGYAWKGFPGATVLALIGWIAGCWVRRSLGIRGPDASTGFFVRMCERARGSRRGVLEWLIERIRGNEFTLQKCRAICDAYENAVMKLRDGADAAMKARIIEDLDRRVKEISYD